MLMMTASSSLLWRRSHHQLNLHLWILLKSEGDEVVLFELTAEAGNAAGEGEMQVHPWDGADASIRYINH